ncbi:MAG TPA: hypothetical protein VE685_11445 [Thermoanaerobaculia bacterium]|nr:hypothetical protein [Thermoanaerobaculia bacterium]
MRTPRSISTALLAGVLGAGAILPSQPRAFQVLVFGALLAAFGSAGRRLALRLLPDAGRLSRAVAAFSLAVGLAVVPATWLGHFGLLRPRWFLLLAAVLFLLSRLVPVPPSAPVPLLKEERERNPIETALLIAAAASLALLLADRMAADFFDRPGLRNYDDLYYHLTAVATWHRHGDLRMVKFSMGDSATTFYPVLSEVTAWTVLAPFGDSDVAARWVELPFALASLLAVAALARRLGLSLGTSAFAALLYASVRRASPFLALAAGNDHATAFFTLAALDGALETVRSPRPGTAAYAGIALGLLLGTKYIGVLNAATILGVLLIVFLARGRSLPPLRSLTGPALLLVVAMAAAGGYTYLRNAVTAGNPLFPAPVRLFGHEILPGWQGVTLDSEIDFDVPRFLTARPDLFGPFFPFTLLPAALLAPVAALFWRRVPVEKRIETAAVLALPIVLFFQFLLLMHDHRENRYFFAGIALAAAAFAWLSERAGPRIGPVLRSLILLGIAWQALRELGLSDGQSLLGIAVLVAVTWLSQRIEVPRVPVERLAWIGAALLVLAAFPLGAAIGRYQEVKLRDRPAPLFLDRIAGREGTRAAYVGWNQPYLYFGSHLQNDVTIVPRNRNLAAQYYHWGGTREFPFRKGRYRLWRENLDRLGIEYVIVVRSPWDRPEQRWIARHPGHFRLVYQDAENEIWRVLRNST